MLELRTALIALAVCAAFNLGTQALAAAGQPSQNEAAKPASQVDHGTLVIKAPEDMKNDEARPQEHAGKAPAPSDGGIASTDRRDSQGAGGPMEGRNSARDFRDDQRSAEDGRLGPDERMAPPPQAMARDWREAPRGMMDGGQMDDRFGSAGRMGPPPQDMARNWREAPRGMMDGGRMDGRFGPAGRMGPPPGRGYGMGPDPRMGPQAGRGMDPRFGRMPRGMGPDPRMQRGGPECQQHGWRGQDCPQYGWRGGDRSMSMPPQMRRPDGPEDDYGVRMLPPAGYGR